MREPHPSGGGVDEALRVMGRLVALAACALVGVFILGMLLKPVLPMGLPSGHDGRVLLSIVIAIGLALAHVAVIVGFERSRWAVAGLGAASWRPLGLLAALALGAGASLLTGVALLLAQVGTLAPREAGSWTAHAWSAFGDAAIVSLVAALIWHGYAFGLIEERWGRVSASVVTGLGLALAALWSHAMPATTFVALAALGVFLGGVRAHTGNLIAAWLSHLSVLWVALAVFHSSDPRFVRAAPPGYAFELDATGAFSSGPWGLVGSAAAGAVFLGLAVVALWRAPQRR